MEETCGTYVDDARLEIHEYDDDTDDDAYTETDDDTTDDTHDNTDDGWGGNLYPVKAQGSWTLSGHE